MDAKVDVDEALLKEAMEATGLQTTREAVEEALRAVIKNAERRRALNELWGIGWDGDLERMRAEWAMDDFKLCSSSTALC